MTNNVFTINETFVVASNNLFKYKYTNLIDNGGCFCLDREISRGKCLAMEICVVVATNVYSEETHVFLRKNAVEDADENPIERSRRNEYRTISSMCD